MTGRLSGLNAVITGAAGGIGSAAARAFVGEGAAVGLVDLPGDQLTALAVELGPAAVALPTDVTDEISVSAAISRWAEQRNSLDILYTCAGVQLHGVDGPAHLTALDTWNRTFAVNVTGTFLTVKHALPLLLNSDHASVLICGSPTGLTMCGAGYSAYSASKGAVMSLARTLAADYASAGVRVNVVVPGTIRTPLIEALLTDPRIGDGLVAGTPLGRLGTADDLAGIAVFLASAESKIATGATFTVDGGLTVR